MKQARFGLPMLEAKGRYNVMRNAGKRGAGFAAKSSARLKPHSITLNIYHFIMFKWNVTSTMQLAVKVVRAAITGKFVVTCWI